MKISSEKIIVICILIIGVLSLYLGISIEDCNQSNAANARLRNTISELAGTVDNQSKTIISYKQKLDFFMKQFGQDGESDDLPIIDTLYDKSDIYNL